MNAFYLRLACITIICNNLEEEKSLYANRDIKGNCVLLVLKTQMEISMSKVAARNALSASHYTYKL